MPIAPLDGNRWHTPESALSGAMIIRSIIAPVELLPHLSGAFEELTNTDNWYETPGGMTAEDTVQEIMDMLDFYYIPQFVGAICMFASEELPPGWLAFGESYQRIQYPELWAVVPAEWKDSDFVILPSMSNRYVSGASPGFPLGESFSQNQKTINIANLPEHVHSYTPPIADPESDGPGVPGIGATVLGPVQETGATGNNTPFNIRPQSISFSFAIFAGRHYPT